MEDRERRTDNKSANNISYNIGMLNKIRSETA